VCYFFTHEAAGASGGEIAKLRSNVIASEAKQSTLAFFLPRGFASRSLSSGAHSRDPLARNDDFRFVIIRESG
jgi:hypothetical protein